MVFSARVIEALGCLLVGGHHGTFALPAYARGRKVDAASGDSDSVEGESLEINISLKHKTIGWTKMC